MKLFKVFIQNDQKQIGQSNLSLISKVDISEEDKITNALRNFEIFNNLDEGTATL